MNNIVLEEISNARITIHWFMYGVKPTQKMWINGEFKFILSTPYDISTTVEITEK